MGNIANDADHLLTTEFPPQDDLRAWIKFWCVEDDGTIDCVPLPIRHHVRRWIGPDGRLNEPNMVPDTPLQTARLMHMGSGLPQPPWVGQGDMTEVQHLYREIFGEIAKIEVPEPEPLPGFERTGAAHLYMIRSAAGPIKIGISVDPAKRLKGLQTAHPWKLSLLCVVEGGAYLESEYHFRFAEHRLAGEWFNPAPEILAEIERLRETD